MPTQSQEIIKSDQSKRLTAKEEQALCQRIQECPQDKDAQTHLIETNIGLIRTIANTKQGRGIDVDDLVQEGCIALLQAARHFDTTCGFRLSTFATWRITQALQRYIDNYGSLIHLPAYQHEAARKLKRQERTENREDGGQGTPSKTILKPERITHAPQTMRTVLSLDSTINEEETVSIGDTILDADENTEAIVLQSMLHRDIERVLEEVLNPRERRVMRLRYGIGDDKDHTLEEIATAERVTRERIRQIQEIALSKLRGSPLTHKLLAQFAETDVSAKEQPTHTTSQKRRQRR